MADEAVAEDRVLDAPLGPQVALALNLVERAAAQLHQQDAELERLHRLIEGLLELGQPLAVVDGSVVRGWSAGFEDASGVTAEQAIGRSLHGLLGVDVPVGGIAEWTDPHGGRWRVHRPAVQDDLSIARLEPAD